MSIAIAIDPTTSAAPTARRGRRSSSRRLPTGPIILCRAAGGKGLTSDPTSRFSAGRSLERRFEGLIVAGEVRYEAELVVAQAGRDLGRRPADVFAGRCV